MALKHEIKLPLIPIKNKSFLIFQTNLKDWLKKNIIQFQNTWIRKSKIINIIVLTVSLSLLLRY